MESAQFKFGVNGASGIEMVCLIVNLIVQMGNLAL